MPDRRGKFFLRHFGFVALLFALGLTLNGNAPIALPLMIILGVMTFPMNLLLIFGDQMTGRIPDDVLLEYPIIAYGTTAILFALLALNSYLWALLFCRPRQTKPQAAGTTDRPVSGSEPAAKQLG